MQPYLCLPLALETSSAARRPAAGWKPGRPGMPLGREIRPFTSSQTTVSAGVQALLKASPPAAQPGPPPSSGGLGPPTGAVLNVTLGLESIPLPPAGTSMGPQSLATTGHLCTFPLTRVLHVGLRGAKEPPPPGSSISAQLRLVHPPGSLQLTLPPTRPSSGPAALFLALPAKQPACLLRFRPRRWGWDMSAGFLKLQGTPGRL